MRGRDNAADAHPARESMRPEQPDYIVRDRITSAIARKLARNIQPEDDTFMAYRLLRIAADEFDARINEEVDRLINRHFA